MIHTKRSKQPDDNFIRIAEGLDVGPINKLLAAKPELWDEITARQKSSNSAHKDTECIFVRGPLKMSHYYVMFDLGAYDYPVMDYLERALVPLLKPVLDWLEVEEMGRVLIVKLKPGGHVNAHDDQGAYADHYARFHLVLQSNKDSSQTCGEQNQVFNVGDVWWFDHKQVHTADNAGDTDRVHIIFDAVTNLFPMGGVPVTDDDDVILEECGVGYDRH